MKLIDPTLFYIVRAELQQTLWRIPLRDVFSAYNSGKSLYLVDIYNGYIACTIPLFILEDYVKLDVENTPIVYIQHETEEEIVLSKLTQQLLLKVHFSWLNIMWDLFHSDIFIKFVQETKKLRESYEVFPLQMDVLNAFIIDARNIKGVIVSEHGYPNKFNNGMCLSTFEKAKPKTLKAIELAIFPFQGFAWHLTNDCLHLVNQGIMLLQYNLTTHTHCEELFLKVLELLKEQATFLFLGSGLQKYQKLVNNSFFERHPIEVLREGKEYKTDVFKHFSESTKISW